MEQEEVVGCDGQQHASTQQRCEKRRVYAISDLHVDYAENMEWVRSFADAGGAHQRDALIVAGDVSDDLALLQAALEILCAGFYSVHFCPGNHDLWKCRKKKGSNRCSDSTEKLRRVNAICRELGVHIVPHLFAGRVWIVPQFSWYAGKLRGGRDVPSLDGGMLCAWMDFSNCVFPNVGPSIEFTGRNVGAKLAEAKLIDDFFLSKNNNTGDEFDYDALRTSPYPVITFSHFVPRYDLNPSQEWLLFKELDAVSVSPSLDALVRKAGSSVHVYGHTHIPRDKIIDRVRYVSHPLGYPRESAYCTVRKRDASDFVVWEVGSSF